MVVVILMVEVMAVAVLEVVAVTMAICDGLAGSCICQENRRDYHQPPRPP